MNRPGSTRRHSKVAPPSRRSVRVLTGGRLWAFASRLKTHRGCLSTTIPDPGCAEAAAAKAVHPAPTAKIRGTKGASIGKVPFGDGSPDERLNRAGAGRNYCGW